MDIKKQFKQRFVLGFVFTAIVSLLAGYVIGAVGALIIGIAKDVRAEERGEEIPKTGNIIATVAGSVAAVGISVLASKIWETVGTFL